jgi:hypothetical protein
MKLPTISIKFQSPIIIKVRGKLGFLKTLEREFEQGRMLNALRIYKIYTGLGLKEAKDDFDALSVITNRHSAEGRKYIINGLKKNILDRNIKVLTREEFELKSRNQ